MSRLIAFLRSKYKELQEKLRTSESDYVSLQKRLDLAKKSCASLLSQNIFMNNSEEFLTDLLVSKQINLLTLLRSVRDKTLNINAELHKLDIKIQNRCFDTFISCKSQDYKADYE